MNIKTFLKEHGYAGPVDDPIYRGEAIYWYKKVGLTSHQFIVKEWNFPRLGKPSYEVEMSYETRDGVWANTKFYGLSAEDLVQHLKRLETGLFNALLPMGADLNSYQWEDDSEN